MENNGSASSEKIPSSEEYGAVQQMQVLEPNPTRYRLYKQRFSGLFGFVILGAVSAMGWPWFGPISNNSQSINLL